MKLKILLSTTQPAIACSKLETTETCSMKYVQANKRHQNDTKLCYWKCICITQFVN